MTYRLAYLFLLVSLISCLDEGGKKGSSGNGQEKAMAAKPAFTDTTACIFSQITYCPNPQEQLDKHLPVWKIIWNPTPVGGNYAFVASNDDMYVLAIRGSLLSFSEEAFNNWVYHDLNVAVQDKWPYGGSEGARISQGSYIAWQNLEKMKDRANSETLWEFLSGHLASDRPLMLTGHSLGGNLAMVYASYLSWKLKENGLADIPVNLVTFAAPAPGNRAFAEEFDRRFPASVRIENTNDIVPKFPCSNRISELAELYSPGPSAAAITIGYRDIRMQLNKVFTYIGTALRLLEIGTSFSSYLHTNLDGRQITIPLSGKHTGNNAADWFAEAGYQHGMAQYAAYLGAPVICP